MISFVMLLYVNTAPVCDKKKRIKRTDISTLLKKTIGLMFLSGSRVFNQRVPSTSPGGSVKNIILTHAEYSKKSIGVIFGTFNFHNREFLRNSG